MKIETIRAVSAMIFGIQNSRISRRRWLSKSTTSNVLERLNLESKVATLPSSWRSSRSGNLPIGFLFKNCSKLAGLSRSKIFSNFSMSPIVTDLKNSIKTLCSILVIGFSLVTLPRTAKADFWGGDLPLLAQIVTNTLHTMYELQRQSQFMNDALRGINDRINRIQTIADVVRPADWDKWKDPREALNRLRIVYHTIPKEYRSEKYDQIESELAQAMNLVARVGAHTDTTFRSGKELEQRGADSSPGVAQKLTASGVGTLIALESQSQVIQSHITSLLAQMLAEGNERETRSVASRGGSLKSVSNNLSQRESQFSAVALRLGRN